MTYELYKFAFYLPTYKSLSFVVPTKCSLCELSRPDFSHSNINWLDLLMWRHYKCH